MKAVMLTGIRQMKICDIPTPQIMNAHDVLLKIEKVGVCGSDVHYYETGRIGSQVVQYPFIVGHECSATVAAVGSAVHRLAVGQQVAVEPAVACHKCDQCKQGRENTCYNLRFLGTPGQGGGCLCEYIIMPEENCFPTNGALTLEQAALCEPLSIAIYSVKQSQIKKGSNIAILGSGPIGLSCLLAAKAAGAESCFVTDKIDDRVKIARNNGATWAGNPTKQNIVREILTQIPLGVDVVFECAGQQETIDQAVDLLQPGGKLILVGIPREDRISFSIDKIRRKEITIINIRRQNKCVEPAIQLVRSRRINVDFLITHRFDFLHTQDAFELVAGYRDGVVKAIIEF